ncbi:MAG: hypothetical protein JWN44_1343 [Myxococcales bacterium]|nr:hypothetical protein [Myxococcales bacterium]
MAEERLTPSEVQLVLRRAAELERRDHGDEALTATEVEELAADAGLSAAAVRQALGEVRVGALQVARPPGALERVLGQRAIVVERTVRGEPTAVQRRIDRALRAQSLRKKRDFGARSLWEPSPGWVAALRRALDGQVRLGQAHELEATVVESAPGQSTVRFVVDAGALQRKVVIGAGLGTVAGIGAAVALWATGAPVGLEWIAAAGATAMGSLSSLRSYRREVSSAATALEHLLDTLEQERTPQSALDLLFAR